jgi:hypothetical protein
MKHLLCLLSLILLAAPELRAQVVAASCSTADVQTAINTATEGQTVTIPACSSGVSWTSGVNVSGKGIKILGAGSGRIIALDDGATDLTIGTGTKTITIALFSPGFSSASITAGQTLRLTQTNNRPNFMQGTVTSLVGSVLTMNITSTGGSGTAHRWMVSTLPQTVLIANSTTTLFTVTEDTAFHTEIGGIQFAAGTGTQPYITVFFAASGKAVLIHDSWLQHSNSQTVSDIFFLTNRGVVWNSSFDGSNGGGQNMATTSPVHTKIASPQTGQNAWIQQSFWGTLDTTGENNMYVETNDFHAFQAAIDNDDNARTVWRFNLMDHATFATHGADTSSYGERYFEYYNNTGNFNGYGNGTTFNMANGWIGFVRGGTFVAHDNNLPAISSQDFSKPDIELTIFNLQEFAGPNPCWGAGFATPGQFYHTPRQAGFGRVTGTGTANYPPDGVNNSTTDSVTYVGDSEPIFVWNNNRTFSVSLPNFGGTACTNPDSTGNYVVSGRDFFIGTAKPSYTPFTYPHPLTLSGVPSAPGGLTASVSGTSVALTWGPPASGPVSSYSVYRGTTHGGPYTKIASGVLSTSFTDSGLANGTYFYVVTAVNNIGEGAQSNETSATIPASITVGFSPLSLAYGSFTVGTSSPTQTVTLSSTSSAGATVTISSISITGTNATDFSQTNNCPASLNPGQSCTITVTFTPTAAGTRTATVAVVDNAMGSPQTVALSGTGVTQIPAVSLNPTSLSFGAQSLSTTSTTRSIVLTNTGTGTLTVSGVSLTGTNPGDFAQTNNCTSVAAGLTCHIDVTFTPTATGLRSASVSIADNATGSPQIAALTGVGITTKCQMTGPVALTGAAQVCP